jgi:hypothetical protein
MNTLAGIAAALAAIPDAELRALRTALDGASVRGEKLLSWLESALAWETDRRAGVCRRLTGPRAVICRQCDIESSLVALAFLHAPLRNVTGAANLLDATAAALCAAGPVQ